MLFRIVMFPGEKLNQSEYSSLAIRHLSIFQANKLVVKHNCWSCWSVPTLLTCFTIIAYPGCVHEIVCVPKPTYFFAISVEYVFGGWSFGASLVSIILNKPTPCHSHLQTAFYLFQSKAYKILYLTIFWNAWMWMVTVELYGVQGAWQ